MKIPKPTKEQTIIGIVLALLIALCVYAPTRIKPSKGHSYHYFVRYSLTNGFGNCDVISSVQIDSIEGIQAMAWHISTNETYHLRGQPVFVDNFILLKKD